MKTGGVEAAAAQSDMWSRLYGRWFEREVELALAAYAYAEHEAAPEAWPCP